jgi:iron(III) transport system ATP-binding protein
VYSSSKGVFVTPNRRGFGMVFQSYAIWPHMSVFDNVAYPLRIRKLGTAVVRDKTLEALRLVEMSAYADRPATALSGGQQQRVAIARAIAFEPSVLLLDEPLSNLDAKLREQMRLELRGLQKRLGITTIYVTHDQEEAMSLSDLIVVMRQGEVLQVSDPESVYFRPASLAVAAFCGSPNILPAVTGDTTTGAEGIHLVQVIGEGWKGRARAPAPIAPGQDVSVIVRPEHLVVTAAGDGVAGTGDAALAWSGEVIQNVFGGFRRTLIVRAGPHEIIVDAPADRHLPVGTHVRLSIDPARTWVLQERPSPQGAAA